MFAMIARVSPSARWHFYTLYRGNPLELGADLVFFHEMYVDQVDPDDNQWYRRLATGQGR